MKIFTLQRNSPQVQGKIGKGYSAQTTIGEMFDENNEHFGWTLEDTVRAEGIKVKGDTAIPATGNGMVYKMGVRKSGKYGDVVVIYTEKNGEEYILKHGGIQFSYILAHGGNHHKDTMGCVLIAKNIVDLDTIQGSLKKEIYNRVKALIDQGHEVGLKVVNMPQSN